MRYYGKILKIVSLPVRIINCVQRTLAIVTVVKHDGINVNVIHPRLNGSKNVV